MPQRTHETEAADVQHMPSRRPPTLRVFRYRDGATSLQNVVGDGDLPLPEADLLKWARDALDQQTFVAQTVPFEGTTHSNELCFIPRDDRCDILSIHADSRRRHHGDHRRSLLEILNDLAAAVACGRLRFLDPDELAQELALGEAILERPLTDSATVATARTDVTDALEHLGFSRERREETVLCLSEASTNAVMHGGGRGTLRLMKLDGRARIVVADRGPGLSFMNWLGARGGTQASMGYGYHIILEHIDDVALSTGPGGTTLILDQHPRRPEVTTSC